MSVQHLGEKHFSSYLAVISAFAIFSSHLMPRPGIELTAELQLLEGPLKGAQPTELHGRGRLL